MLGLETSKLGQCRLERFVEVGKPTDLQEQFTFFRGQNFRHPKKLLIHEPELREAGSIPNFIRDYVPSVLDRIVKALEPGQGHGEKRSPL
ncbi:MAG: hypothetical protein TH68_01755 [Candidatus Synechococcus spongiarum 142]|uniref:Uncharacterized protein n=1 Tax=Candidatus Synechococcus spongiarum 142 TaxID=1608213 RepID=A0A6N3XDB0_9SYNE|nr:MAG: hypothetical protein TH68_01755 [Candidatus Synechococcus spongiarum 142]